MSRPDQRSDAALAYRAWYWTPRWRARAKAQLRLQPLCQRCLERGLIVAASVANHVVPHKGDEALFWHGELQSVCAPCHDGPIQAEEARGYRIGNDVNGVPLDPNHPWNRPKS